MDRIKKAVLLIVLGFGLPSMGWTTCTDAPSGLISWWPGDGTSADIKGVNSGSLVGGVTFDANGKVASAFKFDGANRYVDLGKMPTTPATAFTIEAWVKPNSFVDAWGGAGFIVSDSRDCCGWSEGGIGLHLGVDQAPRAYFYRPNNTQVEVRGAVGMTTNEWHHLAVTFSGTSLKIYQDGVLRGTTTVALTTVKPSTRTLQMGRHVDCTDGHCYPFHGLIDEVAIFNRALAETEITAIFNAGSDGKCKDTLVSAACVEPPDNLVSWWPADGNAVDIKDGNPGSNVGGVTFVPGKVRSAFSFDGSNQYINLGNKASLKPTAAYTIEAWVKPSDVVDDWGGAGFIISDSRDCCGWSEGGLGLHLGVNQAPRAYFYRPNNTQVEVRGEIGMTANEWHHLAVTFSGTSLKIYQDGVLRGTTTFASTTVKPSTRSLQLGRHVDCTAGHCYSFHGLIDEVALFNRALTEAEITAIFGAGSAGKCKATNTALTDTTAPTVAITSPVKDDVFSSTATSTAVTVQAADAVGVAGVNVQSIYGAVTNSAAATLGTGTAQSGTWTASVPIALPVPVGGAFTFIAKAWDAAGNTNSVTTVVDNDGIAAEIDVNLATGADESSVFSSEFSDIAAGGTTAGKIRNRGGWNVLVSKLASPLGVRISAADAGAAPGIARIVNAGNTVETQLDAAGETVDITGAAAPSTSITVTAVTTAGTIQLLMPPTGSPGKKTKYFLSEGDTMTLGSPAHNLGPGTVVYDVVDETDQSVGVSGGLAKDDILAITPEGSNGEIIIANTDLIASTIAIRNVTVTLNKGDSITVDVAVGRSAVIVNTGTNVLSITVDGPADTLQPGESQIAMKGSADPLGELRVMISEVRLPSGIAMSLTTKVLAAKAAMTRRNTTAALNQLEAFINEVKAQSGKKLTVHQAKQLISAANQIRLIISAPK